MRQEFVKAMMPKVEAGRRQQHIFRWGTTVLVLVLAALKLWTWAWLALGIAAFCTVIDIGLAIVLGLVAVAAAQLPSDNTHDASSNRAA